MSGIFGVVSKGNCAETLFYATDYHSHLGTEYGGLAVLNGDDFTRQIHNLSQSQFKSKFYDDYERIRGNKGIGVISDYDEQPIYLNSRFGPFCIGATGYVENAEELAREMLDKKVSFSEVSGRAVNTPELMAKLINQGDSLIDGIQRAFASIEGSCSLLLLHKDGIYAARDKFGYTPLIIGKRSDAWAVTSETSAFPNNGFDVAKHVEPGEIVLLSDDGMVQSKPATGGPSQICTFLWIRLRRYKCRDCQRKMRTIPREARHGYRRRSCLRRSGFRRGPRIGIRHGIGQALPAAPGEIHAGIRQKLYAALAANARPDCQDEADSDS